MGELSIAEQQQVSIAKALAGDAKVLILDEPSAILTDAEIDVLFDVVRRLTASGVSVIYISHRLDELFRIADQVTVMRDGQTIGTYPIKELSVRQIAELMVGGILSDERPRARRPGGRTAAGPVGSDPHGEVPRRQRGGAPRRDRRSLRAGRIGRLRDRRLHLRHGPRDHRADPAQRQAVAPHSPQHAQQLGIALLPANRKLEGMFSFQSIAFNISAGHLKLLSRLGMFDGPGARKVRCRRT